MSDCRSLRGAPKKWSGRWGCRPLVGMGVLEVQKLEAPKHPEFNPILHAGTAPSYSLLVSISASTKVPAKFRGSFARLRTHKVLSVGAAI